MDERILNLLSLCMQAKEKGHDCFFNYRPHVNIVCIEVYVNGWHSMKSFDDNFYISTETDDVRYGYNGVQEAEDYIKGLMEE